MSKISQYAQNTSPALTDYLIGVQASGPTTKRYVLSDLVTLFLNNIPATEGSLTFVSSGLIWSGDAYASTRAASMTAGRIRVVTSFLSIAAVTARVFTASKDTYVDVLDNGDGTGTLVYTEVANNAASPALAANSTRIAIIVTGATTIAAVGSINQGQEGKVLPIASSIPYMVTDSLGNLICPRDPNHEILGYRENITGATTVSTSQVQITPLTVPVIIPTGRKVEVEFYAGQVYNTTATARVELDIWEGTTGSGTLLNSAYGVGNNSFSAGNATVKRNYTPASTSLSYNASLSANNAGTATLQASSTVPISLTVKLK